jgi:hypothetical protein
MRPFQGDYQRRLLATVRPGQFIPVADDAVLQMHKDVTEHADKGTLYSSWGFEEPEWHKGLANFSYEEEFSIEDEDILGLVDHLDDDQKRLAIERLYYLYIEEEDFDTPEIEEKLDEYVELLPTDHGVGRNTLSKRGIKSYSTLHM